MSELDEKWVWISGQENRYMVSTYGRVLSFRKDVPSILKPEIDKTGRMRVSIDGL